MIPPRLEEVLSDLALLADRQERIDYLIALGQEFVNPGPDEVPRTPENRVPGCESEAYVTKRDGQIKIAVDNPQGISAMAMAAILMQSLPGEDPASIQEVPEDIVYRIFGNELSMGKSMGLTGMVRMVKALAVG
ncbi:MAG TPA: SufE family protein [Fimbriimonadaceae bacterium]|nr:SufE family protein [Fimbriimonadaceae bacterium]